MRTLWIFPVMVAGISLGGLAQAGERIDQDEARRLVEQGQIMPLDRLLSEQADRLKGRMLDVHLERSHGRLVYEIEVLGTDGRVREFYMDAGSGELLKTEIEH